MEEDKRKKRRRREKTPETKCEVSPPGGNCCRRNLFLWALVSCTVVGYVSGVILRSVWTPSSQAMHLIGLPGQLVLRSFLMVIVPLLFCSLVLGMSSLRKGGDARMVALTIGFFLLLSGMSAVMGAAAGHLVHPGKKIATHSLVDEDDQRPAGRKGLILDSMLDLIWNGIPSNIIEAAFVKEYTHVEVMNSSSVDGNIVYKKSVRRTQGVNFMGLLTFSILFGVCLARLGEKGEQLHRLIEQLNAVITKLLGYFLNLLPLGMLFWMLNEGLESGASLQLLGHVGVFLATAMGCVVLHQFVLLPFLYVALVRRNPLRYHLRLLPAMLTAFGTASSAATLPATVRCAEESNRLNRCVTRFVLPLGMVVHMNGGTMYMPLCTLFLAQLEGVEIGLAETIVMCITSLLLFISAPGVPSGGSPVYLLTVSAAAGISRPQHISLILSMEWLMERFRTVMNVVADSYVAAFVEALCKDSLPPQEEEEGAEPGIYPTASLIRGYDRQAIEGDSAV